MIRMLFATATTLVVLAPGGCGPTTTKPADPVNKIVMEVYHIGPGGVGAGAQIHMTAIALGQGETIGTYDRQVELPWEHTILPDPGIRVDVTLTVTMWLEGGALIGCTMTVNGVIQESKKTVNRSETEIMKNATLTCGAHN